MIYLFLYSIICGAYVQGINAGEQKIVAGERAITIQSSGAAEPMLGEATRLRELYKKYKTREKCLFGAYAVTAACGFATSAYCVLGSTEEACFRQEWEVSVAGGALLAACLVGWGVRIWQESTRSSQPENRCKVNGTCKSLAARFFGSFSVSCLPIGMLAGAADIKALGSAMLLMSPYGFIVDRILVVDYTIKDLDEVLEGIPS